MLATPILVVALYIRFSKLRTQLNGVEEENAKQIAALRREIAELQKQIAAQTVAPARVQEHRKDDAKAEVPIADAEKQQPAQHTFPPVTVIPPRPTPAPVPIEPAKVDVPPRAPVAPRRMRTGGCRMNFT